MFTKGWVQAQNAAVVGDGCWISEFRAASTAEHICLTMQLTAMNADIDSIRGRLVSLLRKELIGA